MTDSADAFAMAYFPAEWASAQATTGKLGQRRRRTLRRRAQYERAMEPLREAGKSCGSCANFGEGPPGIDGMVCLAESGHDGYVKAEAADLCPTWRAQG